MSSAATRDKERAERARTRPKPTGKWEDGTDDPAAEKARQDKISERMTAADKKAAAEQERKDRELFDEGRKDAEEERAAKAKNRPAKKPAAKARARTAKRQVKRGAALARTAPQGSFVGILAASMGLIGLYVLLHSASELSGFLGGIQKAIRWLASPTAVINFKGGKP